MCDRFAGAFVQLEFQLFCLLRFYRYYKLGVRSLFVRLGLPHLELVASLYYIFWSLLSNFIVSTTFRAIASKQPIANLKLKPGSFEAVTTS
ncbi:MAG: hypothetical protein HC930_01100 [Hydrococcus sp. SU_1_0]|nr:hypothetical protein [Hydrococcus sp. SU_1_0]